jgi:hypothetical protein
MAQLLIKLDSHLSPTSLAVGLAAENAVLHVGWKEKRLERIKYL